MKKFNRICVLVLDGFGVGALKDAEKFGDLGSHTLEHTLAARPQTKLPHLEGLGLFESAGLKRPSRSTQSQHAFFSKMNEISAGKDTTTGHWEMMGLPVQKPFSFFPQGFPKQIMDEFVKINNLPGFLGNKPASGTEIIKELGEEHISSGKPIVYTSADSVFQIAAHEVYFGLQRLYEVCEATRKLLNQTEYVVGRVIARPFLGSNSHNFKRTLNRKDYSIKPHGDTCLTRMKAAGLSVIGIGKIPSIYDYEGIGLSVSSKGDDDGINQTINILKTKKDKGLVFSNLNDLDTLYGHRRNPEGYAQQLEHIDSRLPEIMNCIQRDDLLVVVSDHGNDPTHRGTDHTREYVPLLMYSPSFSIKQLKDSQLETRSSFCDLGQSILENFDLKHLNHGQSFLKELA